LFEELSGGPLPNGRRPDITLAIFPHLREFIAVDLRVSPATVALIFADDVFNEEYYQAVESEFSASLREGKDHPFAHLMSMPTHVDDIVRGVAMNSILDRMGVDFHDEEHLPEVVVFVISGPVLAAPVDQLVDGFTDLLSGRTEPAEVSKWSETLRGLVIREASSHPVTSETLGESLTSDALDPYMIWQNRN
jgi:hypothetical protein